MKLSPMNPVLFFLIITKIVLNEASCLSNPRHAWRLKRNLNMDWEEALEAFSIVFSSPFNDKFPTRLVTGLQDFTPLFDSSYVIQFADDDGGNRVIETVKNYNVGDTCASANARMDSLDIGVVTDVEWFHAIDQDDEGTVSYYFGFESCKATTSTGKALSIDESNEVCNEWNIRMFILNSVKKRSCVIENYYRDDVLEYCQTISQDSKII